MTHCIILAGGFATRLWPLTEHTAKPLLTVAQKPILEHILDSLPADIGVTITTNAVFVHDMHAFIEKAHPRQRVSVFQEDGHSEQQKTGALAAAALTVRECDIVDDILLLGGDNLFGFDLEEFITTAQQLQTPHVATYDIGSTAAARQFGVAVTKLGSTEIVQFLEKPEHPPSTLVATAAFYIPRAYLPQMHDYAAEHNDDIGGLFEHYLSLGIRCDAYPFEEYWYDIGSFQHYIAANCELIGDQTLIDPTAQLINCTTSGTVIVEQGSVVENTHLENAIITKNTRITDADIRQSVIGCGSYVSNVSLAGICLREGSYVVTQARYQRLNDY